MRGEELSRLEYSMKVLGIFGSPRRGGNTEILLEEALSLLPFFS